jgi:ketosteroid isomerase-like protein
MGTFRRIGALCLLMCLLGKAVLPQSGGSRGPATGSSVEGEQKIRDALAHWVTAYHSRDAEGMMAIWSKTAIGWLAGEGDISYDATRKWYVETLFPSSPSATHLSLEINEVKVSDSLAYVRSTGILVYKVDKEKVSIFKNLQIWEQEQDGAWRITRWMSYEE